jgi:signal transduction histidine kinase
MRNLVEGMLTLAQADNGKVQTLFQPLDFSDLVSKTVLPFEPLLYEKNCLLRCDIAPDIHLSGSAQHLQQVVEILLDNAGKYAIPGIIRLTLTRQGRNALLSVSNPGAPISPEDQKRIFERFYRVDQARERNGSFGLGLAIAQSIVTDHGGKIWVESNDSGNCFFVQLPL